MRYFTRRWYDAIQDFASASEIPSPWSDRILALLSDLPKESYLAYLETVRDHLDDGSRLLIASSPSQWHDARILDIECRQKHATILLEDQLSRGRYHREVQITFDDVIRISETRGLQGQYVLCDELAVHLNGAREYSLLLDKAELSVWFHSVAIAFVEKNR